MTLQLHCTIEKNNVEAIEDWLCTLEVSHWTLTKINPQDTTYILEGFFDNEKSCMDEWHIIANEFPYLQSIKPTTQIIQDQEWQNEYKKYLKPWNTGHLHWVPLWEKANYALPASHLAVFLDAGMAFGTGAHETTRLCAERLMQTYNQYPPAKQDFTIIDAGCGSGILAISANILGYKNIYAFDNDPLAIDVSQENALLNNASDICFSINDIQKGLDGKKADFIMANIQADVLIHGASFIIQALNPKGRLALSGILTQEVMNVQKHFEKVASDNNRENFSLESKQLGEWSDLYIVFNQ